jgi:MOSC domain-containing protein YiiM
MDTFRIEELRIGTVRPFGPAGVPSGIDKHPVSGPVPAGPEGLAGDTQGDRKHHGGPDKAIHAYPVASLPLWARDLPGQAALFRPGAFGENLSVSGVAEADICLGDRWRLGSVLLEVSQGRQPCWKLNLRFGLPDMARKVQETGRSGWYFRVQEEGPLAAGMEARLEARPNPQWTLTRVSDLLYRDTLNLAALSEFATLAGLPETWRSMAQARLARHETESWARRLTTPE